MSKISKYIFKSYTYVKSDKNLGITDTLPDQRSSSFHLPEEGGKEFLLFVKNPENRPPHNFLPHVQTDICEYLCMF